MLGVAGAAGLALAAFLFGYAVGTPPGATVPDDRMEAALRMAKHILESEQDQSFRQKLNRARRLEEEGKLDEDGRLMEEPNQPTP